MTALVNHASTMDTALILRTTTIASAKGHLLAAIVNKWLFHVPMTLISSVRTAGPAPYKQEVTIWPQRTAFVAPCILVGSVRRNTTPVTRTSVNMENVWSYQIQHSSVSAVLDTLANSASMTSTSAAQLPAKMVVVVHLVTQR